MKRTLCIVLWTIAAIAFAYAWTHFTLTWSLRLAEAVAGFLGGSEVALAFSYLPFAATPPVFCVATLTLGFLGRLPGTRRKSSQSCSSS